MEITANVPGATAAIDGVVTTLPANFLWYPRSTHTVFMMGTMPISAQSRYRFTRWEDGNTSLARQIVMPNATLRVLATYQTEHLVSVSAMPAAGGTIHGDGWYGEGTRAQLEARPASGYVFTRFTGDVTSSQAALTLTVTGPLNVAAQFSPGFTVGGTALKNGSGSGEAVGLLSPLGQADWRMSAAAGEGEDR